MTKLNWHKYTNLEQFPVTPEISVARCCFYAAGILGVLAMVVVWGYVLMIG